MKTKKEYEIQLAYLQLWAFKLRPRYVYEIVQSVNCLVDPPFRNKHENELKQDYNRLFIKHLAKQINEQEQSEDFLKAIELLEKALIN